MKIRLLIGLMMLLLTPIGVQAQSWGFDVASMKAFIDDHKEIRSEMWVRAVVEEGNALLLTWENDTIKGYKTINDVLDKYDHYFEMLDFIIKGACTVIKVKKTGEMVATRLTEMGTLLSDFNDKCLSQGRLESSDILIIEIGENMVNAIVGDVGELVDTMTKLLVFSGTTNVLGLTAMSTTNLMLILENINQCVDNIAAVVNRSYVKLRGYILARMGPFFRRSVYRSRPIIEIGTDALSRWLEASHGKMK